MPFEVIPFKQRKGTKPPPARQNHVQALPSRAELEIRFPRVEGYQQRIRNRVAGDWDSKRIDVFLSPYWGFAVERLTEAIHPAVMGGEDAELPRYETRRGEGSTAEVDFWTVKKVKEVEKSHLNYVVHDSKWEQSAAYYLDTSEHVVSFVKNQGLGFAIPYLHAGGDHEYFPDFLVRLNNGVTLILEPKGHDELEGIKVQAAERWVSAVNADGRYGDWRYALVHNMNEIPVLLRGACARLPRCGWCRRGRDTRSGRPRRRRWGHSRRSFSR